MPFCRDSVRWLYRLEHNFSWASSHAVGEDLVFRDRKGAVRLLVAADGLITVTRDYAWNGCSPKVCVFDILIGTPDGVVYAGSGRPKTYYASLIHDALYQFLPDGLPLRRRHADRFFRMLLAESAFAPRWIYWVVVRAIGWIVWRATRRVRELQGERQNAAELAESVPHAASGGT